MKLFFYYKDPDCIWFRLGRNGYGLSIKRTEMLFSERYGNRKYLKLPFGWRLALVKPFGKAKKSEDSFLKKGSYE